MTHEGSHWGRTLDDIKELIPAATLLPGLAIRGGDVRKESAAKDIQK
jgi:hypothetical protein